MISPILIKRRQRRYKAKVLRPAPLLLLEANGGPATMTLTFDRLLDLTGVVVTAFTLDDPTGSGQQYVGTGTATQMSAGVLRIHLAAAGPAVGSVLTITVGAGNGVMAYGDGGLWAGVVGLELPFPE